MFVSSISSFPVTISSSEGEYLDCRNYSLTLVDVLVVNAQRVKEPLPVYKEFVTKLLLVPTIIIGLNPDGTHRMYDTKSIIEHPGFAPNASIAVPDTPIEYCLLPGTNFLTRRYPFFIELMVIDIPKK